MRPVVRLAIAAVVVVAVVVGGLLAFTGGDDQGVAAPITVTLPSGPVTVPVDADNQLDPGEQREARDAGLDLHEDARDETPPGVSLAEVKAGKLRTALLARKELVAPQPPAGAQAYSCRRRPVVNQSALSGRRVGVALHFTVSDPGSLNAIFGLFNRGSFGASSNYGFELLNLRCEQWVPTGRKAWAQGAANSAYVSIEIISKDRSRASWLATPAFKRGTLAALVRDLMKQIGAPLRKVDPKGCVWTPGIVDHDSLECRNTHWDVGKHFPWDVFMSQVRRGTSPSPLTKRQQTACDLLNGHRKRARQRGRWLAESLARARVLKARVPAGRCPAKDRKT